MTTHRRRTAAVAPAAGYSRPPSVAPDGLRVTVQTEDGKTRRFDFSAIEAPPGVVRSLAAAFAEKSGPAGTWNQMSTVQNGWEAVKRFLLFIAREHPSVTEVKDVTKDVWLAWCTKTASPGGRNTPAARMRSLLGEVNDLPAETRMVLRGTVEKNHMSRTTDAYQSGEVRRIVRAARRVLRAAEARIAANREALDVYLAGLERPDTVRVRLVGEEWSVGKVLDHLSRTGRTPSFKGVPARRSAPLREALGVGPSPRPYRTALFPTLHEVYAAMILLADAEALNLSVMARIRLSGITNQPGPKPGQPIYQVDVDKPRRGAARYDDGPITFAGRSATRRVELT